MSGFFAHRVFAWLLIPWGLLAIPSVPLSMHDCHGFIGLLAHSPLYAFVALTGGLVAVGAGVVVKALQT